MGSWGTVYKVSVNEDFITVEIYMYVQHEKNNNQFTNKGHSVKSTFLATWGPVGGGGVY